MRPFQSLGRTGSPCRDCSERDAECHAKCEKYAAYQEVHIEEVRAIKGNKHKHLQTFWTPEQKRATEDFKSKVWKQSKK